ncbi:myosin-16-like [Neocloeon triangulifer]|uniref:myosin-16-like n=1 Tax=Neocloeon triangulifer TaxID=2078957 RepID=UPI00286EC0B9|nr:myosin-16-like [Neocloeon triangulifer]
MGKYEEDIEASSARFIKIIEENRKHQRDLMETVQEKILENRKLEEEKLQLIYKNNQMKAAHAKIRSQSQLELSQVEEQIANLESIAAEGKRFRVKLQQAEERLQNQRGVFEQQLTERDRNTADLDFKVGQLQAKLQQQQVTQQSLRDKLDAEGRSSQEKGQQLKKVQNAYRQTQREKNDILEKYEALAAKSAEQDKAIHAHCEQLQKLEAELKINREASLMNPSIQSQLFERQKREARLLQRIQELMQEKRDPEVEQDLEEQKRENERLEASVRVLEQRLEKTERLNDSLVQKLQEAKTVALNKVGRLEKEHSEVAAELRRKIELVAAEREGMRLKLDREGKLSKEKVEKLQAECEVQHKSIVELKSVSEEMQNLAKNAKIELKKQTEKSETLRKEAENLRVELQARKIECDHVKNEMRKVQDELGKVKVSEAACRKELGALNEAVNKKISAIKVEFEKASKQLRSSSKTNLELQKVLDEVKEELEEKQKILILKSEENAEFCKKIAAHEEQVKKLGAEVSRLVSREKEYQKTVQKLQQEVKEKSEKLEEKEQEIVCAEKEKSEMRYTVRCFGEENQQLSSKCAELESRVVRQTKDGDLLKASLSDLKKQNDALIEKFRNSAKLLKTNLTHAPSQGGQGGDFSEEVANDWRNLEAFDEKLKEIIDKNERNLADKEQQLANLNQQMSQLHANIRKLEEKNHQETQAVDNLKEETSQLLQKVKNLTAEKRKMEMLRDQTMAENASVLDMLASSSRRVQELESCVAAFDQGALEDKYTKMKKVLRKLKSRHEVLEKERDGLKAALFQVKVKESEVDDLKKAFERQSREINTLKMKEQQKKGVRKYVARHQEPDLLRQGCFDLLKGLMETYEKEPANFEKLAQCKELKKKVAESENAREVFQEIECLLKKK